MLFRSAYIANAASTRPYEDAFLDALREQGFERGRNLVYDVRHCDGDPARLPALIDELVALKPDVLAGIEQVALAVRGAVGELAVNWRKHGHALDFGIGIAQGYATIGAIGFEGRRDYGTIGTVCNTAARLCGEAKPGQILISQRVCVRVEDVVSIESAGELTLKGLSKPLPAYSVLGAK